MTAIQQVFSGQETNYFLPQGKVFFAAINPITKLPEDKARFVGNVPEEGFIIAPTVETVQHNESITGKNRRDAVFYPKQSLTVTVRLENIDVENLSQAMFGTSLRLLEATVTNETHTAYKGYSFSLNRPNVGNLTIVNPSGLVFNQDYRVNLKTGEVFIPENSQIVDGSLVTIYYTAPPVNRITGYTGLNTEVWLRFNGVNMADKLNLIVAEIFKVRFNPASVLDFLKNAFPGTQLELIGEALYEPRLEKVAGYEGGIFRIFSIAKTIDNFTPEPDPFVPDGSSTYCQLNVSSFRPVDTVNGEFTYCQLSGSVINSFRPAGPPDLPDPEIVLLLSGNGVNNSTNIIDSSSNPKSITVIGNTRISTDQSRFGGSSILFNGGGDRLSVTNNDFAFGLDDFTIEAWVRPSGSGSPFARVIQSGNFGSGGDWQLLRDASGGTTFGYWFDIDGGSTRLILSGTVDSNAWHFIAIVRENSIVKMAIDGTVVATAPSSHNLTRTTITIGASEDGGESNPMFLDELRISRVAREITLPTAPF